MTPHYNAIPGGGDHNGLVAAGYLARADHRSVQMHSARCSSTG